jgi:hypothetical protein
MAVFEPVHIDNDSDEEYVRSQSNPKDVLWNALTGLALLSMLALVVLVGFIYTNPGANYNPFPPPTMPAVLVIPSETPTPLPPTETPIPLPTYTAEPTYTAAPATVTSTVIGAGRTPTATAEPQNSVYAFQPQGVPAPIDATILYPDRGACQWMGVGGQVTDMQGRPVIGIGVVLGGYLDGRTINMTSLTGTALKYGEAGYEFTLTNEAPFNSEAVYWVRLVDQQRLPLSPKVIFDTSEDCATRLVIINFKQVR